MRRALLILAVLGILGLAASQAQANYYHHGGYHGGYHHGAYYGRYYGGYYGPVVVRPPVWVGPRAIVPVPPTAVYGPAYACPYYAPYPRYGFYYQGRGLSLGIGF
jgi:hypothetical protein